ncbi:hypothetical protein A4Z71_01010 [Candidatus Rhodoluna planktonica]|uniref:Uncharacterized protein n=1 Tax=Candidatus Rhodoluna planktonica TaxID=535712 RepID=A0A1D9DXU2_9MICO|nr:hypothetical protein A4Z71_01010 [Candidatus Rhodoluna planktonica]
MALLDFDLPVAPRNKKCSGADAQSSKTRKRDLVLVHLRRSTFGFLVGVNNPLNFFEGLLTTETGGLWLLTA